MKRFVYTVEELRTRNGYRDKRVTLYRVTRDDVRQVAQEVYQFKSDCQAARELAASRGLFKPGAEHPAEYVSGWTVCGNARFKQI